MRPNKVYDGKELFEKYHSWGAAASSKRLREWARENMPNRKTGNSSQMGVFYSMWRWAFQHPEEAFESWKEWYFYSFPEDELNKPEHRDELFQNFLITLRDRAMNPNVSRRRDLERFCAKYGIPMKFNIENRDVVQVTRKDHPLFQVLLEVDKVEGDEIQAHYITPEGTYSNHQLKVRQVGVVGKVIV